MGKLCIIHIRNGSGITVETGIKTAKRQLCHFEHPGWSKFPGTGFVRRHTSLGSVSPVKPAISFHPLFTGLMWTDTLKEAKGNQPKGIR